MDYLEKLDKIYDIKEDFKNVFPLFGIAEPGDRFSDYPDLIRQRKNPYDLFFEEVPGEYVEEYKKIDDKWYKVFKKKFKYVYADDVFVGGDVVGMEETAPPMLVSGKLSSSIYAWYVSQSAITVHINMPAGSYNEDTKEFSFLYPTEDSKLAFWGNTGITELHYIPSGMTSVDNMLSTASNVKVVKTELWDGSEVKKAGCVCYGCKYVTELDFSNWRKLEDMHEMFHGCTALKTLKLVNFSFAHATNVYNMFNGCTALTDVTGPVDGISIALDLTSCPLTNESAMVFINGLAPVTSSKTIRFKSTTYNTLTAEQKAIATSKGWSVTT